MQADTSVLPGQRDAPQRVLGNRLGDRPRMLDEQLSHWAQHAVLQGNEADRSAIPGQFHRQSLDRHLLAGASQHNDRAGRKQPTTSDAYESQKQSRRDNRNAWSDQT